MSVLALTHSLATVAVISRTVITVISIQSACVALMEIAQLFSAEYVHSMELSPTRN